MPRDPRVQRLQRLRQERRTRAAGRSCRTQATVHGDVPRGPRPRDTGRILLALVLLAFLLGLLLYAAGHTDVVRWVQALLHSLSPRALAPFAQRPLVQRPAAMQYHDRAESLTGARLFRPGTLRERCPRAATG